MDFIGLPRFREAHDRAAVASSEEARRGTFVNGSVLAGKAFRNVWNCTFNPAIG